MACSRRNSDVIPSNWSWYCPYDGAMGKAARYELNYLSVHGGLQKLFLHILS